MGLLSKDDLDYYLSQLGAYFAIMLRDNPGDLYKELYSHYDAVPLDKLCEWLAEYASLPVDEYMISAMAWRRKLKKWMEEHNATDNP